MVEEEHREKVKKIVEELEKRKHSPDEQHKWILKNRGLMTDILAIVGLPALIGLSLEVGASPIVAGVLSLGEMFFVYDFIRNLHEIKEKAKEKLAEVL